MEVDFKRKSIRRLHVDSGPSRDIYPGAYTYSYRGLYVEDNTIHTCTHSEIIQFDYSSFQIINRYSHPKFNDLHHLAFIDGAMFVLSTGIDHVGRIYDGGRVEMFPVFSGDHSFDIDGKTDYRGIDTKPHLAHPNFLFWLDGGVWVTRFNQKDAVRLDDIEDRIPLGDHFPHDGLVTGDKVFFTTVNGCVLVVSAESRMVIGEIDINALYGTKNLGWCRGIDVISNTGYVGFTTLRKTKHRENIRWLTNALERMRSVNPARIIKLDLDRGVLIDEMTFTREELSIIFSIKSVH